MISQTAEYALRSMVALAAQPNVPMLTRDMAALTKIPSGYLSKVLQSLKRAELVESFHGKGGGFVLSRAAADITLCDVVQAVDPIQRIRTCPLGLPNHGIKLCPLHKQLDNAMKTVEDTLRNITLANLLAQTKQPKPLCDISGE